MSNDNWLDEVKDQFTLPPGSYLTWDEVAEMCEITNQDGSKTIKVRTRRGKWVTLLRIEGIQNRISSQP